MRRREQVAADPARRTGRRMADAHAGKEGLRPGVERAGPARGAPEGEHLHFTRVAAGSAPAARVHSQAPPTHAPGEVAAWRPRGNPMCQPPTPPTPGQIVRVRQRQYLVEEVLPPPAPGD